MRKAEVNLSEEEKDLEKEIADYRNSLLIYRYQQDMLFQKLDTVVLEEDIQSLYERSISRRD